MKKKIKCNYTVYIKKQKLEKTKKEKKTKR